MSNDETKKEDKVEQVNFKGMSYDKIKEKFAKKLTNSRQQAFEKEFGEIYKKYEDALAIVRGLEKEMEQKYVEFTENV